MDEREHEIVARAIAEADGFTGFSWPDGHFGAIAQAAISALDSHRAKNAGEVATDLRFRGRYAHESEAEAATRRYETAMKAANLITSLRSIIEEKDEALRLLEVGGYPIKGSQPIHDPTQLHAWDLGCKDTREMVSAIAARARSSLSDGVE